MAFIQCDFYSEVLGLSTSMNVILPQNTETQIGMKNNAGGDKYPVLYLLHGLSDDHTIWQRRTSIERYVAPLGLAVVMPAVHRSFYTDMEKGYDYWTFISEEVPVRAREFFPVSEKGEDNYVAGLSMGGYGAFKLALNHPDRFAAAASLSGALNIVSHIEETPEDEELAREFKLIFGDLENVRESNSDLFYLVKKLKQYRGKQPRLFQCCGTEDFLYEDNIAFRDLCQEEGIELTYEEEPAVHEWGYWDKMIQRVLEWLPLTM
ncbi:MAG: alpha/beta hydrolase [Halanaerobiales bacterium]